MRKKLTWLLMLIGALSFVLTACPKKEEPKDDSKEEAEADDEEADDEAKDDEAKDDEAKDDEAKDDEAKDDTKADEEKAEENLPSRENYIEATVGIGCNDLNPALDTAQKTEKRKDVLAKYGFDEKSYDKTQAKYKDDPTVKPVVASRVTKDGCKVGKATVDEKKKVFAGGTYQGAIRGGGANGRVNLSIRGGRVSGNVKGTRNGEKFLTGLQGAYKNGTITGSGANKNTHLRLTGRVNGTKITGTLSGSVNAKPATLTFGASRN